MPSRPSSTRMSSSSSRRGSRPKPRMLNLNVMDDLGERVFQLEAQADDTVQVVRAMIESQWGVPMAAQTLLFRGKPMNDSKNLMENGLGDHDMIQVRQTQKQGARQSTGLTRVSTADLQAQQYIEREIRQKNILENMEEALEHSPESFAKVYMLYVSVRIGKIKIPAFVDSGAQTTIMSERLAKKCELIRLLDKRFAGIAYGVGQMKILGKIHSVDIKIGKRKFKCAVTVLEDTGAQNQMDFMLGLDMLRKHQCSIDLKNDCLHIGGDDEILIPFLAEKQLPANMRLTSQQDVENAR